MSPIRAVGAGAVAIIAAVSIAVATHNLPGIGNSSPPADCFIANTGSDATGTGTQGNPYLSMDKCYQTLAPSAASAKTVEMACGTYVVQALLTASRGGNTGVITYRPPSGSGQSCVFINGALVFGTRKSDGSTNASSATYVTVDNVTVGGAQTNPTTDYRVDTNGSADHITITNSKLTRFEISGTNITMGPGNDVGECKANASSPCLSRVISGVGVSNPSGVVITGNSIHDVGSSNYGSYHPDGLACFACVGVVVSKNKWWNNGETNIRFQTQGSPANSSNTVENNWFNFPWAGNASLGTYGTGAGGTPNNNCIDVDDNEPNLVLRFNSMAIRNGSPSCNLGTGNSTNTTLAGNIEGDAGACQSNVTHSYNIIYRFSSGNPSSACGTDSLQAWNTGANYTNTDLQNLLDFHLTGANGAADNFVPCGSVVGGCVSTDIDGTSRPVGANADAGADER